MSNPIYTLEANAKKRQAGIPVSPYPTEAISRELRRMGYKRTPGTNGEGRQVAVTVNGQTYNVLAIER